MISGYPWGIVDGVVNRGTLGLINKGGDTPVETGAE